MNSDLFVVMSTLLFLLLPALLITRIGHGVRGMHKLMRSMVRFPRTVSWYLLPLLAVPALTFVAALPAPPDVSAQKVLSAYVTAFLPALLFQFVTTNWWEETVWMGFFQGPLQHRFGPWRALLLTTPFFALEHLSLMVGGTLTEGATQLALILAVSLPTRALLAWTYNRTASISLVGLVHGVSNAAGLAFVPRLWNQAGGGGSALLFIGITAIVVTRGRLGFHRSDEAVRGKGCDPRKKDAVAIARRQQAGARTA